MTDTEPTLRNRLTTALRDAAYDCDGNCGKNEAECRDEHPIQVAVLTFGEVSHLDGPIDGLADVVLGVVQPLLDAKDAERDEWEQRFDHEAMNTAGIFHEYYRRWQSTIVQARRQAARADKATARGDIWKAKAVAIEQDRDRLTAEAASLRTVARAAAVLLHDTADRASGGIAIHAGVLRGAAKAIDGLTPDGLCCQQAEPTCGVMNPRKAATCTKTEQHPDDTHRDAFGNTWPKHADDKPLFPKET